jgi:hypothetical protein
MSTVKPRKPKSPIRKDTLMRRISDSVGRDEMLDVLAHASDERASRLLELLCDPAYRNHSFPKLCERVGLKQTEVLQHFRRFHLDQGLIEMARRAPQVMKDVAEDAMKHEVDCHRCGGQGEMVVEGMVNQVEGQMVECPQCTGTGRLKTRGDAAARKLFFGAMGLTGKKGPLVAQQFNLKQDREGTDSLEGLITVAEKAMSKG